MKVVFLVYVRSGSHLLARLATGDPSLRIIHTAQTPFVLNSVSEPCNLYTRACPGFMDMLTGPDDGTNKIFVVYSHETRPERRAPQDGGLWDKPSVSTMADTKIVHLIRDGRNQVESWYQHLNRTRKVAKKELLSRQEDAFETWCSSFAGRASRSIECSDLNNYMLVKFEDLVTDPVGCLTSVYEFLSLSVQRDVVGQNFLAITPNSSFHSDVDPRRWLSWSREEREIFHRIAGRELIHLGYEVDNSWISG